ncbi:unnamed protein product [Prorocentrum cordatum]|uniref:Protein C10 n=1 Tax=Prorocentrum cordatum TaxID=2364126 RepID=A0ABN9Y638_9DINO|nr:unnamed protein product [Polarella glacialis]
MRFRHLPDAPALHTAAGALASPAEQACCLPECAESTTTTTSTTSTTVTATTEAPLVSEDDLVTGAVAGGVAIGLLCLCGAFWLACHRFPDAVDRFVPDAIASSPRFRHYRTFTGSLSPFGAGRGKCMGAVAPDGEASCDLVDVRPQPDALQSTAWATPVAPPATKAACPPRLGRAAALEMADAFVVEFSALSFQQALREACQEAHGDLRREVRQRRSLCDPIRFRVISKYGFPPDPVGVCQCSAAFAELLPDDKELQELNWKLSALLQTRPQDWDTQFAPLCSDMTLDCEPPAPPNLSPLRPIVDPVGWERPGAVTNVVR